MQDYNARQIIAYTLSQGLGQDIAADDVIAVSAMEAVGVAAAMARFQAIPGNPKVWTPESLTQTACPALLAVQALKKQTWSRSSAASTLQLPDI